MGLAKRMWEEQESRGFGHVDGSLCAPHLRDPYLTGTLLPKRTTGECLICHETNNLQIDADDLAVELMEIATGGMSPPNDWREPVHETADLLWENFGTLFDEDPVEYFEHISDADRVHEWALPFLEALWDEDAAVSSPSSKWLAFREMVQYRSRFAFLTTAKSDLGLEDGVEAAEFVTYLTHLMEVYGNRLIQVLPAGAAFHRARMIHSPNDADAMSTALKIGPAPRDHAAANRMSPAGISMLYAAEDHETAISEIAVHDRDHRNYALVGRLASLRDLRILDLFDVDAPSIFDRSRWAERTDKQFLIQFAQDIAKPIDLDGREHREYSPTQVLTEVIRWTTEPRVDGIRYRSAQNGKPTLVMFFEEGSVVDLPTDDAGAAFGVCAGDFTVHKVTRQVSVRRMRRFVVPEGYWAEA